MRKKNDAYDPLDLRIAEALRLDGRKSNRELARQLDVAEGTIRKRLKRLRSHGLLQIAAMIDPRPMGFTFDVALTIRVELPRLEDIACALRDMPEVRYVAAMAGAYDLLIVLSLRSADALTDFVTNTLARIPGVRHTETAVILQILKRTYDYWPLPAQPAVPAPVTASAADGDVGSRARSPAAASPPEQAERRVQTRNRVE